MASDDFELHRALEEMAPAAVRTLVDLATNPAVSAEMREEALVRLRQIAASGLIEQVPGDLRRQVTRLLES